jgi:hypothetical protein
MRIAPTRNSPYSRIFRSFCAELAAEKDSVAERDGFEPAAPRGPSMGGIRPEFGALFNPNESISAGENLFARVRLGSLRFPSSRG